MENKQLELPKDKVIDVKKLTNKDWQTRTEVLPSGAVRIISTKRPPEKK